MSGRRFFAFLVVGVVVGVLTLIFAHGLTQDPRAIPTPLIGKPAPGFKLPDLKGEEKSLADFSGRPVILNFWASWCGPCRDEARVLELTSKLYSEKDLVVVGINIQDETAAAEQFIREQEVTFANLRDAEGRIPIEYGVYGVPETFFIDRNGMIADKIVGPVRVENLRASLSKIVPMPEMTE